MNRRRKLRLVKIITLIILAILIFFAGMNKMKSDLTPKISSDLIVNRLEEAKELTTLKYHYTNMGQFENQNDFYGWKVPFTTKSFIVSYDGIINAGVDLKDANVEIKDKKIEINLSNSKILSHEIDENSLQIFLEKDSIFNPLKIEDYNTFSKDQKETVEKKAIKKGLLAEANEKSIKAIQELLKLDERLKDYTIEIKFN
ncbi:DUF4230 domain-containing protein [Lagierella sp.]|uniref:DUF4230 domain-containing protein n=1 Tax=Lagierella sp. TaxID=2849657 RepID=UPI0026152F41|nr:DUF4230 domain-containing protein [Lagierella sp.]